MTKKERRPNWKYESLCIAVKYILKEEGERTCEGLANRIGVNRSQLGRVLRGMSDKGEIIGTGWPKLYEVVE